MKVVFITNIPAPYREKVYELVAVNEDIDFEVYYCAKLESNRQWKFREGVYKRKYLKSQRLSFLGRDFYFFSNVWSRLTAKNPDVVIVAGFSLPMIFSYVWALFNRKKIVSFTDAHIRFESRLTFFHRFLRKFFYLRSAACVGASKKSLELFGSYGVVPDRLFQSHLCANNEMYYLASKGGEDRNYDVILCGRISKEKMFYFSAAVIEIMHSIKRDLKVLVVGDGPEREQFIAHLSSLKVDYEYAGFVSQEALPSLYSDSKVFLFPSRNDAWGVVANESCAAGTPVLSCEAVGAAGELLQDSVNARILPLDASLWARNAIELIDNPQLWNVYSESATRLVAEYNYENAALGLVSAIRYAYQKL